MPRALHEAGLKLYRQYLAVGGIPEVIARFIDTQDYIQIRHLPETIRMTYNSNHIEGSKLTEDQTMTLCRINY